MVCHKNFLPFGQRNRFIDKRLLFEYLEVILVLFDPIGNPAVGNDGVRL